MTRNDRLLDLVRSLRDGRLHRAEDLARRFGVSQRTIYRDLDTLIASGVPVAGERGLGYKAVAVVTLPPINLAADEVEALRLGLALAAEDEGAGEAARRLAAKVEAALPDGTGTGTATPGLATGAFADAARGFRHVAAVRAAIRARQKLRLEPGGRVVRPLGLSYWGRVWMLAAWCEATGGFDRVRLDPLTAVVPLPQLFVDEPGRTLADWEAAVRL